jgi:hypothetical protein
MEHERPKVLPLAYRTPPGNVTTSPAPPR